MQSRIIERTILMGAAMLLALALIAQEPTKPRIVIKAISPEPVAEGTCAFSTDGYLEENGKKDGFTDAEFGHMVLPALRQGYILTIYPPTKRGFFISQECQRAEKPKTLALP